MKAANIAKAFLADSVTGAAGALVLIPGAIAVASLAGMPLSAGFAAALISVVIMGAFGSIHWQAPGPAISLTVVCLAVLNEYGLLGLVAATLVCGAAQLAIGLLKMGRLFRMFPPFLLSGVLTGLGFVLIMGQTPLATSYSLDPIRVAIPVVLVAILVLLPLYFKKLPVVPLVVLLGSVTYHLSGVEFMPLPEISWTNVGLIKFGELMSLNSGVVLSGMSLFVLSSSKFLLTSAALEAKGDVGDVDKDSVFLGLSNLACGLIGALPVSLHVGRSFLLRQMNPHTRWASLSQVVWVVGILWFFPEVFGYIPSEVVATLLIYTGIKCIDWNVVERFKTFGANDFFLFVMTALMVVFVDINSGVLFGLIAAAFNLLVTFGVDLTISTRDKKGSTDTVILELEGAVTFISLPALHTTLGELAGEKNVEFDMRNMYFFDEACLGFIQMMEQRFESQGHRLIVDRDILQARLGKPRNLRKDTLKELAKLDRRGEDRLGVKGRRQIDKYLSTEAEQRPADDIDEAS